MLAEDVTLTRQHPLTGENYWHKPGSFRRMRFADVEEVAWAITHAPMDDGFVLFPVTNHLTPAGQAAFLNSGYATRLRAHTLDHAREALANWCQDTNPPFTAMRYAWQTAEPDAEAFSAPYRITRLNPHHYLALRNDPRGWVYTIDLLHGPTPSGSPVIAEAQRYTRAEGADFSGWIISANRGRDHGEPVRLKKDALHQLELAAQQQLHHSAGKN